MKADGAFHPTTTTPLPLKKKLSNQHSCVDIVGIDDVESRELSQNSYTLYMYNYTLYFCDSLGSEKKPGFPLKGGGRKPKGGKPCFRIRVAISRSREQFFPGGWSSGYASV